MWPEKKVAFIPKNLRRRANTRQTRCDHSLDRDTGIKHAFSILIPCQREPSKS